MTKLEFERNMKLLNEDVTPKLRAALHDPAAEPLYVWDNVTLQDSAEYPDMGFARKNRVTIPPHSPDFNKPIEHTWNQVKSKILARLYRESDVELTPQMAQQWVAEAFLSTTTDSIQADVRTLPDTWRIVKSRTNVTVLTSKHEKVQGSDGDYPPSSSYR